MYSNGWLMRELLALDYIQQLMVDERTLIAINYNNTAMDGC